MKKITLIGLTGPDRSGKDATADILVRNANFTKLAFADPLRDEIVQAFGVSLLDLTRAETLEHPITDLAFKRCSDDGFVLRMREHFDLLGWDADASALLKMLAAPRSPLEIMQLWGTEYRRRQHQGHFTLKMFHRIIAARQQGQLNIVIPDCCKENEIDLVRQIYGGDIWHIERPGFTAAPGAHTAKIGAEFSPDLIIDNNGGLDTLEAGVMDAFMFNVAGAGATA